MALHLCAPSPLTGGGKGGNDGAPAVPACDDLVAELQQRYGSRAGQRGNVLPAREAPALLLTGLSALDTALGGGLPRGRLSEPVEPHSAGATTLALTAVAQARR